MDKKKFLQQVYATKKVLEKLEEMNQVQEQDEGPTMSM